MALVEDAAALGEENALEIHLQRLGVGGLLEGLLLGDDVVLDQLEEGLVEVLHAVVGAGLDGDVEFLEAILDDQLGDRGGVDHDLDGGDHGAVFSHGHALHDDGLEGADHLLAHGFALGGGEEVEHA